MTFCPQCNVINRTGAIFCAGCGFPLHSCPHCNTAVRTNARFCQQCGQTVGAASIVCHNCQKVNRSEAKFCSHCRQPLTNLVACSNCGQNNKPEARYCRNCGISLVNQNTTPCLQCGYGLRSGARFCPQCGQPSQKQTRKRYETGKLPPQFILNGSDGDTYLIISVVARGGMGAVYKAVRPSDHTVWAIKEMSERVIAAGEWEQTKAAFYAEAELLKVLDHENLPKVIDAFEDNQRHYMVMDFVEGDTLTEVMAQQGGSLAEDEVIAWGKQLCLVLDYLHTHNPPIIYRDLKPDNVMLETATNCIKLIDFGIARRFKSGKKSDTVHLGTSGYAAPEQYGKNDQQSDATTDIYALGATLHQLLTGLDPSQNPFNFPDVKIHTKVSDELATAVAKAVKLKPEQRFQSAAEMYKALADESLPVRPASKRKPVAAAKAPAKAVTPTAGSTQIVQATAALKASDIVKGAEKEFSLPVRLQSGRLDVSTDADWLTVSPEVATRSTKEIVITADTSLLPLRHQKRDVVYQPDSLPGRIWWLLLWLTYAHAYYLVPHPTDHQATVYVGKERVDVEVGIIPSKDRTDLGWVGSGAAVAAEVAGLGWLLWFLLVGI
jgi:serine/threonine protein kinase/ribosomal protein L37E